MKKKVVKEEIGRNWQTIDNDPVQYYDVTPAVIEIYPVEGGKYEVDIEVPDDPSLSAPVRTFPSQGEAELYARQYAEFVAKVINSLKER